MKTVSCGNGLVSVLAFLLFASSAVAGAAVPEIAATSLVIEGNKDHGGPGPFMVYGDNLDGTNVAVHVTWSPPKTNEWTKGELQASLDRLRAGAIDYGAEPAQKQGWITALVNDKNAVAVPPTGSPGGANAGALVIRVRNGAGCSKPFIANEPEVWGIWPYRPIPGKPAQIWGVNLGGIYVKGTAVFVDGSGKIAGISDAGALHHPHSKREEQNYAKGFIMPPDLKPGRYSLYCFVGFGDPGWGKPLIIEVVNQKADPAFVVNVREEGAVGDGLHDDTEALQKAIEKAFAKGGGRVFVPPGSYLVTSALTVRENVELCGVTPDACMLITTPAKEFGGRFPEETLYTPTDVPEREKDREVIDGRMFKNYGGYPIDWLPGVFRKTSMVWIQSNAGIQNLTLDGSGATRLAGIILVGDKKGGVCHNPVVKNCHITYKGVYIQARAWYDDFEVVGLLNPSGTEGLVLEGNRFRTTGANVSSYHTPLGNVGASICWNEFAPAVPYDSGLLVFFTALQDSLVQANQVSNFGRGLDHQCDPVRHNCYRLNIFRDGRKNDGEILMSESGTGKSWFGQVKGGDATHLTVMDHAKHYSDPKRTTPWQEGEFREFAVIVNGGRGMGQVRTVVANTADTVEIDRPWAVVPDASSHIIMIQNVIENVFLGNEFHNCRGYTGVYGSAVRNVWCGEEYEHVGLGLCLWSIEKPGPIAMNVIQDNNMFSNAGITLIGFRGLRDPKNWPREYPEWVKAYNNLVKVFGNEIRGNTVVERKNRYANNGCTASTIRGHIGNDAYGSNGAGWDTTTTEHGAIDVITLQRDASAPVKELGAVSRWNLLYNNFIVRSLIGIRTHPDVDRTLIIDNTYVDTPVPVQNEGAQTLDVGGIYRTNNVSKEH